MSAGTVILVEETLAGSELAGAVGAGTYGSGLYGDGSYGGSGFPFSTIIVEDPTDFVPEGGTLLIGTDELDYLTVDEFTGAIALEDTLGTIYEVGERVLVVPETIERFAHVQLEGQEETLQARIPHALYDRLPVGLRDENFDEAELVELGRSPDGELIVVDVLEREPSLDGSFIDPVTLPDPQPTDGLAPVVSPQPVVLGGVASLFVQWIAVANHDLVKYEVHVSTSSGFTPGVGTYAGETPSTFFVVRSLPGTTNPPAYGTTYYVRLVAKDDDGPAPASNQTAATPADGMDSVIITDFLAANSITADKLAVVMALASALVAGTIGAQRVEVGYGTDGGVIDPGFLGIRAFDVDGSTVTFRLDGLTGEAFLSGRVDWGTASRLLKSDVLEIQEQPTTTFETPSHVQTAKTMIANVGSVVDISVAWPSPTQPGNLLLAVLTSCDTDSFNGNVADTPAGWTFLQNTARQEGTTRYVRQQLFKVENAASRSGTETFHFPATADRPTDAILQVFEYDGADVQDVRAAGIGGSGTAVSSSDLPAPLAQSGEILLGFVGVQVTVGTSDDADATDPLNGFVRYGVATSAFGVLGSHEYELVVPDPTPLPLKVTLAQPARWVAQLVAFTPAPVGVPTPDTGKVRAYAKDVDGIARLHSRSSDGSEGSVALAKADETMLFEYAAVTIDIASTASHSGGSQSVTIPGLATGDVCFWEGQDGGANGVQYWTEPVCTSPDTIVLHRFNADAVTLDPVSTTHHFFIIHRA